MFNIILCDKNLNNIKHLVEHISSLKNKKIKIIYIASELEEICSYSLLYKNYFFLINSNDFPEESYELLLSLSKFNFFFYQPNELENALFSSSLENFFDDFDTKYNYSDSQIIEEFKRKKFNFSLDGTIYFLEFIKVFKKYFNNDLSSLKYVLPYLSLKYNLSPNVILWSIITSVEDMCIKNNKFDELKKLSLHLSIDFNDDSILKNILISVLNIFNYK